MPRFPTRAVTAVAAAAVVVAMPPHRDGWSSLAGAVRGDGPVPRLDDVVALVAGTALWCLAGWVIVALGAGRLAALPGACGAAGRLLVRVLVPRVLRGVVVGGVAGSLLLGPAVAAVATPVWPTSPGTGVGAGVRPGPVWPTDTAAPAETTAPPTTAPPATTPPTTAPSTTAPSTTAPPATPPPTTPEAPAPSPTPATGAASVVVGPGDSLWSIAADRLARHGEVPTPARVAAAWPTWFAANRAVIGPDPDLLQPGTRLSAPTPTDGSSS